MARIPDDELERLKRETDLVALVRSRGVELKEQGRDLVGLCPLHEDHEPSLLVTPAKGLWHCLGCGKGGTVVDWVMETEKVSFRHAVEILRSGGPPPAFGAPAKANRSTVLKLAPAVELDIEDQALMRQVLDYYHATLKTSPEALAYLKKRGIDHEEMATAFKLGFANRTLGLRLPGKQREDGVRIRQRLAKLGLYRTTGHEHFNGCLVIPDLRRAGQRGRGLRPQDRPQPGERRRFPPLPARPAPRRLEPARLPRVAGDHPVRGADRRPDLLVLRLSQRLGDLRRQRLHPGAPRGDEGVRHRAGAARLRPRRGGRPRRARALQAAGRRGDHHLPGGVSPLDGRQRVRAQGEAAGPVAGRGPARRGVHGRAGPSGAGSWWPVAGDPRRALLPSRGNGPAGVRGGGGSFSSSRCLLPRRATAAAATRAAPPPATRNPPHNRGDAAAGGVADPPGAAARRPGRGQRAGGGDPLRGPPLAGPGPCQEHILRAAPRQPPPGPGLDPRRLPRRHPRPLRRQAAGRLPPPGLDRAQPQGGGPAQGPGPRAPEARRAAGAGPAQGARAQAGRGGHPRRAARRGARAAQEPAPPRAGPSRPRALRCGGGGDQQAGGLPRRGLEQARQAAGGDGPVELCRRQVGADERRPLLRPGGGAGGVLGDDRASPSSTWGRRTSSTRSWRSPRRRAPRERATP